MAKKELLDYEFELTSEDSFDLKLYVTATNAFVKRQFQKALAATLKKAKMKGVKGDIEEMGAKYEVPKHMFSLARLNSRSMVKDITGQVLEDGIKIINYDIDKMFFYKKENEWVLLIMFTGLYQDLR